MFQSLELSLENKTWLLETYVLISQRKQKKTIKKLEVLKDADAAAVNTELKTASSIQRRGKYVLNIPPGIKAEVGKYALCYGTQAARKRLSSKYPQYEFKQSTVSNWKNKFTKYLDRTEDKFNKVGRPNKVNDEIMLKIKEVIIGIRLAGSVISRKMVISIGKGVLKANNSNSLSEFGGHVTLTDDWARGV